MNGKISDGYTSLMIGKQTLEINKNVPKTAKINLSYRLGEGSGIPRGDTSVFYNKLVEDVSYSKNCTNALSFQVDLLKKNNELILTENIFISSYTADQKSLIRKDVMTDSTRSASSSVTKLIVKNFKCK